MLPYIESIIRLLRQLETVDGSDLVENVLIYLLDRGKMNKESFLNLVKTRLSPGIEDKIMTISEQLIAEGMQQGVYLAHVEVARALLQKGMAAASISEITKLSISEINAVAEQIQH